MRGGLGLMGRENESYREGTGSYGERDWVL